MTPLVFSLSALNAVLAGAVAVSIRAWLRAAVSVLDLKRKIAALKSDVERYQAIAYELAAQRDAALAAPLRLDAKTVGLIRLATSNPERHEAASSALVVCERLKKRLV
jgi:uncharacterized small protein (DUF1192 family)